MVFCVDDIPDLSEKVVIVTGGSAGLGLASAIALVRRGAHVIVTVRSTARGEQALAAIRAALAGPRGAGSPSAASPSAQQQLTQRGLEKLEFGVAEHTDLHSISAFASWFLAKGLPLHVLLLNAGVAFVPYRLLHGVESTLFINHVSHQLLTTLLLPKLQESAPSRVVVVASEAFRWVSKYGVSVVPPTREQYSAGRFYGNSKLANILFARTLQKRCNAAQLDASRTVLVNAAHPGMVATNLPEKTFAPSWLKACATWLLTWLARSPDNGALTQLYLATSPEVVTRDYRGQYFIPTASHQARMPAFAHDDEAADRLWQWTEETIQRVLSEAAPGK